jgi:hypothetical protein
MMKVTIYFRTKHTLTNLGRFKGAAVSGERHPPKSFSDGIVRIERDRLQGILHTKDVTFNSMLELPAAIEKALIGAEVKLHPSTRTRKYIVGK